MGGGGECVSLHAQESLRLIRDLTVEDNDAMILACAVRGCLDAGKCIQTWSHLFVVVNGLEESGEN